LSEHAPEEDLNEPPGPPTIPFKSPVAPEQSPQAEMTNLELQAILLAIARQSNPQPQKKLRVIKEPDPFSGGSPDKLRAFIFQCQIYFHAYDREFTDDAKKVFFAISYLRGIALDYFEPFINEPDPYHNLDFLKDWSAFVQKLSNIFGSYLSEDNDENAIVSIPFPQDGKAVNYFIQFAKYQNWIHWDD